MLCAFIVCFYIPYFECCFLYFQAVMARVPSFCYCAVFAAMLVSVLFEPRQWYVCCSTINQTYVISAREVISNHATYNFGLKGEADQVS